VDGSISAARRKKHQLVRRDGREMLGAAMLRAFRARCFFDAPAARLERRITTSFPDMR
jgi:hypothetical protein